MTSYRFLVWLAAIVAVIYGAQFVYSSRGKNQPADLGVALLHLAAPVVKMENKKNGPKLSLAQVYGGPEKCNWWNLEQFWGRCATAYVDVLSEDNLDSSAATARIYDLLELLAKPCAAKVPASEPISEMLQCDKSRKPYRITIVVRLVNPGPGGLQNTTDPFAWNVQVIGVFLVVSAKGEI
jgi:hypothetical protein